MQTAYDEIVNFIAAGTTSQHLVNFQPSPASRTRVHELLQREKTEGLTQDEQNELDPYLQIEHLMRMVKARAHLHFKHE